MLTVHNEMLPIKEQLGNSTYNSKVTQCVKERNKKLSFIQNSIYYDKLVFVYTDASN